MQIQNYIKQLEIMYPVLDYNSGTVDLKVGDSTSKFFKCQEIRTKFETELNEKLFEYYKHSDYFFLGSCDWGYRFIYNQKNKNYYTIYVLELGVLFAPYKELGKKNKILFCVNGYYSVDKETIVQEVFNKSKTEKDLSVYNLVTNYLKSLT